MRYRKVVFKSNFKKYIFLDENMIRGGQEEGELGIYRRKLMKFLQFSSEYNPQKILYLLNNSKFGLQTHKSKHIS